jgi:hypothetical protein
MVAQRELEDLTCPHGRAACNPQGHSPHWIVRQFAGKEIRYRINPQQSLIQTIQVEDEVRAAAYPCAKLLALEPAFRMEDLPMPGSPSRASAR